MKKRGEYDEACSEAPEFTLRARWNNKREDARGAKGSEAGGRGNLHKQVAVNNCLCEALLRPTDRPSSIEARRGGKGGNPEINGPLKAARERETQYDTEVIIIISPIMK